MYEYPIHVMDTRAAPDGGILGADDDQGVSGLFNGAQDISPQRRDGETVWHFGKGAALKCNLAYGRLIPGGRTVNARRGLIS
jgi:hypothetical protein